MIRTLRWFDFEYASMNFKIRFHRIERVAYRWPLTPVMVVVWYWKYEFTAESFQGVSECWYIWNVLNAYRWRDSLRIRVYFDMKCFCLFIDRGSWSKNFCRNWLFGRSIDSREWSMGTDIGRRYRGDINEEFASSGFVFPVALFLFFSITGAYLGLYFVLQ